MLVIQQRNWSILRHFQRPLSFIPCLHSCLYCSHVRFPNPGLPKAKHSGPSRHDTGCWHAGSLLIRTIVYTVGTQCWSLHYDVSSYFLAELSQSDHMRKKHRWAEMSQERQLCVCRWSSGREQRRAEGRSLHRLSTNPRRCHWPPHCIESCVKRCPWIPSPWKSHVGPVSWNPASFTRHCELSTHPQLAAPLMTAFGGKDVSSVGDITGWRGRIFLAFCPSSVDSGLKHSLFFPFSFHFFLWIPFSSCPPSRPHAVSFLVFRSSPSGCRRVHFITCLLKSFPWLFSLLPTGPLQGPSLFSSQRELSALKALFRMAGRRLLFF